jgi:hypothetical protein
MGMDPPYIGWMIRGKRKKPPGARRFFLGKKPFLRKKSGFWIDRGFMGLR